MPDFTAIRMQCFALLLPVILLSAAGGADAAIQCYQCHGSTSPPDNRPIDASYRNASSGGFQGNHQTHLGPGAGTASCSACHPSNGYTSSHRNGRIDLSANINGSLLNAVYRNGSSGFGQTPTPRLGNCTNVNCHFERGTPTWGSTPLTAPGDCGVCHGAPPSGGDSGAAGSHSKHAAIYTGMNGCSVCHNDHLAEANPFAHATSVGKRPLSILLLGGQGSYDGPLNDFLPKSQTNRFGSCSNVFCHEDGTYAGTGSYRYATPVWGGDPCTACHGNPPAYSSGSPKANSHQKHLFSCNRCHYPTTTDGTTITTAYNHRNESYEVGGPPGETLSYGGARQCYNSYCHGNGTSVATGAVNSNSSPSWGSGGPLACNGCHGYPPAYAKGSPKSNLHLLHNSYGYSCSRCHYATTRDGTTLASGSTTHANRAYDVSGPPDKPLTYNYSAGGGTCTNSYCHSTGQGVANPTAPPTYASPNWGQRFTVRCRQCHNAGYHAFDSFLMNTGSHFKHLQFDSTLHTCRMCHYTPKYGAAGSCYECHNEGTTYIGSGIYTDFSPRGPEHADGVINVAFHPGFPASGATGSYAGDSVPGTPYGSCSNLYCHSQGTTITPPYAPANVPTVTWGAGPLPTDCTGCHGGDINSATPIATLSHGKHQGQDCAKCHAVTAYNSRSAIPNRPLSINYQMYSKGSYHANGGVEVSFLNTTTAINGTYAGQTTTINRPPGTAPGRCTNVYCHTSGTAVVAKTTTYGNLSTPVWGTSGQLGCNSCHGYPPAYADGDPKGNGHLKHNADCSTCHYSVTRDNTTIADRARHSQYRYDVAPAPGISLSYSFAANGSSCSNVSCHTNGGASRDWGTSCIHCHGNPPSSGDHLRSHATSGCQICHYSVTTTGKTITNAALHNNGSRNIAAGPGVSFTNLSTSTMFCSNVSCHSDGTNVATGQVRNSGYGSAWWSSTGSLRCSDCHRDRSYWTTYDYPNGSPKANSHQKHCGTNRLGCHVCHYSVYDSGGNINATLHKNGQYDLKPFTSYLGFTYTYGTNADHSRGGTCTNIICHGDGTAVTTGAPVTASATWGGPSLACNSCHGYPPAYPNGSPKRNGHQGKHLPYSCGKCHSGFPSGHTDGSYTVSPGPYIKMSYNYGYCSNVSCHGDGTSTATMASPTNGPFTWGGTYSYSCDGCHGMPPSYPDRSPKGNAHDRHTAYGCQVCHFNVTADGSAISDRSRHADGFYNISTNGSASFRYTYGYMGSSCSSISCHADGAKQRNWTYQPLGLRYLFPSPDSTGIDVGNPVQLEFLEPIDMTTVNSSTFWLQQGDSIVAGSYSCQYGGSNIYYITFTPSQPLGYFTTYTATFTNGIKAATGVNITSGQTWSFTTGHSPQ